MTKFDQDLKEDRLRKQRPELIYIAHVCLELIGKHKIKYKFQTPKLDEDYFIILWFNNSCCLKISYNDCTNHFYIDFTDRFVNPPGMKGVFDKSSISKEEIEQFFNEYVLESFEQDKKVKS